MNQIGGQIRALLDGLGPRQKWLLIGGGIVTVALILVFVRFLATPDFKPLFTGLEPSDAQRLSTKLAAKNIQVEISSDGKTLSVPADKVDAARLEVATDGMPKSGRLGFEIFDKVTWGQTDFDEKVNYQRALEGELERTIQSVKNVESARVHLVLPTDSIFLDRERHAKASVILKLSINELPEPTRVAITRLVAGAVDQLEPGDVTVVNADGDRPLGSHESGDSAQNEEQELASRMLATIAPVVGADHVRATVNVEFDTSAVDEQQESYDPNTVVATSMQRSEERAGGAALSGVPGTASNLPGAKPGVVAGQTADPGQYSKSENGTYAVNKTVRHTVMPAGRIRRISAAVVVDDVATLTKDGKTEQTRRRTPEEMTQLLEIAKASIGADTTRGDVVTVQNVSFRQEPAEPMPAPTKIMRIEQRIRDYSSVIRYISLLVLFLLVYWLILKPIKKYTMKALSGVTVVAAAGKALVGEAQETHPELALEKQKTTKRKQMLDRAAADPESTSRLIRSWIREGAQ